MTTSTIHKKTLAHAVALLTHIGATYRIEVEGEVHTNMVDAVKKRGYTKTGIKYKALITPIIDLLKQDGVYTTTYKVPEGYEVEAFRSCLSAHLITAFGKGRTMTSVSRANGTIEIIRV